jgi:hypothetical protein
MSGGGSLIRTMPDKGGGGVWKSIIWPDILCEWPLTIFGTYLHTKLKNIDIVEHLHAFKIIV